MQYSENESMLNIILVLDSFVHLRSMRRSWMSQIKIHLYTEQVYGVNPDGLI